jgi:hypothetical protein
LPELAEIRDEWKFTHELIALRQDFIIQTEAQQRKSQQNDRQFPGEGN